MFEELKWFHQRIIRDNRTYLNLYIFVYLVNTVLSNDICFGHTSQSPSTRFQAMCLFHPTPPGMGSDYSTV